MPYAAANFTVTIRGTRDGKQVFARDIEVQIFSTESLPVAEPTLIGVAQWRYGLHWDPDDLLDDGSAIAEGDILLWSQYPSAQLQIENVQVHKPSRSDWVLMTGYIMPVDMGQQASG